MGQRPILTKRTLFTKKGLLKSHHPLFKLFLKILQQRKFFLIFHERGQRAKAGSTFLSRLGSEVLFSWALWAVSMLNQRILLIINHFESRQLSQMWMQWKYIYEFYTFRSSPPEVFCKKSVLPFLIEHPRWLLLYSLRYTIDVREDFIFSLKNTLSIFCII